MYSLTLRKVKNVDNAYKVYNGKERPIITIPKSFFIDSDLVKLDNETVKKIIGLEKELQSIVKDDYVVMGSIKTILNNDRPVLVLPIDTKGLQYNLKDTCYTVTIVCRAVKYIEDNMAIVNWMVEKLVEEDSFSENTDQSDLDEDDVDEEEENDDIEAPTEELLNIKNDCIERVTFLFERLQQIKDEIDNMPLNNIPKIMEDLENFYNEEHEK